VTSLSFSVTLPSCDPVNWEWSYLGRQDLAYARPFRAWRPDRPRLDGYHPRRSAARLGITREYVRRIESLLLSLRRVLSIHFQIVLVVIMRISLLELVVPRNYRTLGGVGHSVMEIRYAITVTSLLHILRARCYKIYYN